MLFKMLYYHYKSNDPRWSVKKGFLKKFSKFIDLRPATLLLKKRLWHRCFPVNFAKLLERPFSQSTSGRLFVSL